MLQSTPIPSMPPPAFNRRVQVSSRTATIDWEQAIKPPPPISSRTDKEPQRPRNTIDLPPLVTTPPTNPSRSSLFLPARTSDRSSSPPRSRASSPTKGSKDSNTNASSTDDNDGKTTTQPRSAKLASWFNGGSESVNLGLVPSPKKEKPDPFSVSEEQGCVQKIDVDYSILTDDHQPTAASSSTPNKLQKRMSTSPTRPQLSPSNPSTSATSSTALSRFSFFKSKSPSASSPSEIQAQEQPDPLLTLSISHALFPHHNDNSPASTSSFSPAAFKNLQQNAEGTLNLYQRSYRSLHSSLHALRSAHTIQSDDLSASQTRADALKTQLSAMAARAQEQEENLKKVTEELREERQCRREEEEMRRGTIKLIQPPPLSQPPSLQPSATFDVNSSESFEESSRGANKTYRGRGGRISDISATASSISSVDIDAASEVDSVFSAPYHPDSHHNRSASPVTTDGGGMSPVAKVIIPLNMTREREREAGRKNGVDRGGEEAWEVVEIMREESQALKSRIAELEAANEEALEMLRGLGL